MTSSMLAGERRWASSRRGGMTVLGKVAVPKPLNLPSQKLENHGLDPNVEIVPKGSLSWGSRPSSSASNPWGSSSVSPNADGSSVSPHHSSGRPSSGSGRPSSGGGLSRPSTSGSDRMHEPSATTWGPNSRPSSASGVLASNQSSLTTSRPLSADRPGSSHLSRFAEAAFDNSMAWGPNGTSDKLPISSKVNDFSLTSGDFPTLGSDKDSTTKSSKTHDHGSHVRPGSSSGTAKERNETSQADAKSGTVQTWTRDGPPHVEDGVYPSTENWQGAPHQYVNPNVPPQHFDAWRGPPVNAPGGVWYRGPPAGPPYPPVPHGGYPMEPFPYYHRPQMPPTLPNSQPGHPPGPRGHHPRNGDFYRPQMPDAFIRPGMPIRPGFYPGPVPYDGYFGPPMGYNPNDREMPFMGMPPGPPVYNMRPGQNPSELGDPHFRPGGRMFGPEQLDSVPPDESRGPYKVLRKSENERDANMEDSWEQTTAANPSALEQSVQPKPSFHNDWGTEAKRNEDMPSRRSTLVENPSRMPEAMHKSKASNENWGKKSEPVTPSFPEIPQDISANPKDPSLIQKIEGLNAKVRASDVQGAAASGSPREEQKNRSLANPNDIPTVAFGSISNSDINTLRGDSISKATAASAPLISRQAHHGGRSRADHHSKGRSINQDTDGWRKKHPNPGSEVAASLPNQNAPHFKTLQGVDNHVFPEKIETKNTEDSSAPIVDPTDGQAQRARMKELAKQRAIQLQKEEEERIREQKAKALAKLEELNRRTLAADVSTQTAEKTVTSVSEQEDVAGFQKPITPVTDAGKHEIPTSDLDLKPQTVAKMSEPIKSGVGPSTKPSRDMSLSSLKNSQQEPAALHDDSTTRQKHVSHRQKQGVQMVESLTEKSTPSGTGETLTGSTNVFIKNPGSNAPGSGEAVPSQESSLTNSSSILPESTQQRKRSNKTNKNKHKHDDALAATVSSATKEGDFAKVSTESTKPESLQVDLDPSTNLVADSKDTVQPNLDHISLPNEEAHGKTTNQYKPQNPRRTSRNPQSNRSADKFHVGDAVVWAPVRAPNKEERGDELTQRTSQDDVPLPAKSINSAQTNPKSKRAEMERYVPKPVAKELAQHGSLQQSSSSSPSSPGKRSSIEEMTVKEELGSQSTVQLSASMGSIGESKSGDNKQNKQVKSHGAWRQRGPNESHREQGFQQGAIMTSNPKKTDHKSVNQHEVSNPVPTETNVMHEWDPSDGWFMPEDPPTKVAPIMKDEGGKGKRPAYKGQKSTTKNHGAEPKDVNSAEMEKTDQTDRPTSKENRSSHWQPKSQPYRGGGQNSGSEVIRDPSNDGRKHEEPSGEYKNPRAPHDEGRRERKPRIHSPTQGHGNVEDEARFEHHQHHASSGFRKYGGGQNNRYGGQDNRRQNNANINRERQRQNLHYEYQPVGSNNNSSNRSGNLEPPADGSGNASLRHKERGSGQFRRGGGNSYGQE